MGRWSVWKFSLCGCCDRASVSRDSYNGLLEEMEGVPMGEVVSVAGVITWHLAITASGTH